MPLTSDQRWKIRRLFKIYLKVNGTCPWCGKHLKFEDATLEHIIPKRFGGNGHQENLAVAHQKCNNARSCNLMLRPVAGFEWIDNRLNMFCNANPEIAKKSRILGFSTFKHKRK